MNTPIVIFWSLLCLSEGSKCALQDDPEVHDLTSLLQLQKSLNAERSRSQQRASLKEALVRPGFQQRLPEVAKTAEADVLTDGHIAEADNSIAHFSSQYSGRHKSRPASEATKAYDWGSGQQGGPEHYKAAMDDWHKNVKAGSDAWVQGAHDWHKNAKNVHKALAKGAHDWNNNAKNVHNAWAKGADDWHKHFQAATDNMHENVKTGQDAFAKHAENWGQSAKEGHVAVQKAIEHGRAEAAKHIKASSQHYDWRQHVSPSQPYDWTQHLPSSQHYDYSKHVKEGHDAAQKAIEHGRAEAAKHIKESSQPYDWRQHVSPSQPYDWTQHMPASEPHDWTKHVPHWQHHVTPGVDWAHHFNKAQADLKKQQIWPS